MISSQEIKAQLCDAFCSSVSASPVPCGFAVGLGFEDASTCDPLSFYVVEEKRLFRLQDDGDFLALLHARGIEFQKGWRLNMLNRILKQSDAFRDKQTWQICTPRFPKTELPERMMRFVQTLIRVRNIALVAPAKSRSRFQKDVMRMMERRYRDQYTFTVGVEKALGEKFIDHPVDLMLTAETTKKVAALYFVSNTAKLLEAQLLHSELLRYRMRHAQAVALVEAEDKVPHIRLARAERLGLTLSIFKNDESAAIEQLGKTMGLAA